MLSVQILSGGTMHTKTAQTFWAAAAFSFMTASLADDQPAKTAQPTRQTPPRAQGYLPQQAMPNGVTLIPPPPAPGSAALAHDEEVNRKALTMQGTPRWDMAIRDAATNLPDVARTFSCALNIPIDEERTPKVIALLRKTLVDAGRATSEAKRVYQRQRPFAVNGKPMCTPSGDGRLRGDGSYPSGHSSLGWALGLVLAEVAPDRADAVIARGRAYGQSRLVCNVHWQSDVIEGQMIGSAVVARLHAEPAFRNDVAAARAEVDALRAKGAKSEADCDAEARTLESWK
jgi:acid phosphatase (class A)